MYFYEIGYSTWESFPVTTLSHSKQFTQSEFDDIVFSAYKDSIPIIEEKNKINYDRMSDEQKKEDWSEGWFYRVIISDMYRHVIDILTCDYGFQKLNIQCSNHNDGDLNINEEDINMNEISDFEKRLITYYKKELPRIRKIDSI